MKSTPQTWGEKVSGARSVGVTFGLVGSNKVTQAAPLTHAENKGFAKQFGRLDGRTARRGSVRRFKPLPLLPGAREV